MSNYSDEKPFIENTDVVQRLRVKTEEEDMKAYLKASFGGYTKQSVLDYINILKKNQQAMSDTFNKNIDSLMADKDKIRKFNEMLQQKLNKAEREYESLTDAITVLKLENVEYSSKHIPLLREHIQTLEKEVTSNKQEAEQKDLFLVKLENINNELASSLEELKVEAESELKAYLKDKEAAEKKCSYFKEHSLNLENSLNEMEENQKQLLIQLEEVQKQLEDKEKYIKELSSKDIIRQESVEDTNQQIMSLKEELKHNKNLELAMEYKISELSKTNKELTLKAEELAALLEAEKQKLLDFGRLLEEETKLKNQAVHLEHRANKLSQELNQKNITLNLRNEELRNSEAIIADITAKMSLMEDELKSSIGQQRSLHYRIDDLEKETEILQKEFDKAKEELESKKRQLWSETMEAKKQMNNAAKLAEQLEQQEGEINYWKELYSKEKSAEFEWRINELMTQLENQSDIIGKQEAEGAMREESMSALNGEILLLKREIAAMKETVDSINNQKEKLTMVNNQLSEKLKELFKSTIELIKEKSELVVDKGIVSKSLTDALSKITTLELQLNKINENAEETKINNVIYRKFVD